MREVLNAKNKRETIKRYISANPEFSNRKIAQYWDVDKQTIANYRRKIGGEVSPENGQKVAKLRHHGTECLPVIMPTDVEYDPGKIKDALLVMMDKIAEMEKARKYLRSYFSYQITDAIEGTMINSGLDWFLDDLNQTLKLFKELVNERNTSYNE